MPLVLLWVPVVDSVFPLSHVRVMLIISTFHILQPSLKFTIWNCRVSLSQEKKLVHGNTTVILISTVSKFIQKEQDKKIHSKCIENNKTNWPDVKGSSVFTNELIFFCLCLYFLS